jgi:hypothetical protein
MYTQPEPDGIKAEDFESNEFAAREHKGPTPALSVS